MAAPTMTPKFHTLKISDIRQEAGDSISIGFAVPEDLREAYRYVQGQYLTLKHTVNKEELRRSYSICAAVSDYSTKSKVWVAIKKVEDGRFSTHAHDHFAIGCDIEVMTPEGRFFSPLTPENDKHYVAFAAGSGITPILSIMKTTLEVEPKSRFTLVYGNRKAQSILFLEELEALKNLYLSRVRLIHILSAQPQEADLFNGRINGEKTTALLNSLIPAETIDQAFICGPSSMIDQVEGALIKAGISKGNVHAERFGVPTTKSITKPIVNSKLIGKSAKLLVQLDGKTQEMAFPFEGTSLLDVALNHGLDLAFACKGGVCCTCRAKVLEGEVKMEKNYTLEQWEIDKGFVLTCQCHPISDAVVVSFDER
jgi:ring-1,2-phenylacetyl-CoA epoxidase subunit PaaE